MPDTAPSDRPLRPAVLVTRAYDADTVEDALRALTGVAISPGWQGIAGTTSGPAAVRLAEGPPWLISSSQQPVALDTVYELTLWQPATPPGGATTGSEWRWTAGTGRAAHLQVRQPSSGDGLVEGEVTAVLVRDTTYLQHGSPTAPLAAIEIFVVEPVFGNVEARDEIVTGSLRGL